MKIALISATKASLDPIENAMRNVSKEIEIVHLVDTELLTMISKEGELTAPIIRRFSLLLNLAIDAKVDVIQLTCSAFNDLADTLKPLYEVKIFRSDEAVLNKALTYEKISIISTVQETPNVLIKYLKNRKATISIDSHIIPGLIHLLYQGRKEEHDKKIRELIYQVESQADAIVLAQFSLEHIAKQVNCSIPILTAPKLAAEQCYEYIKNKQMK